MPSIMQQHLAARWASHLHGTGQTMRHTSWCSRCDSSLVLRVRRTESGEWPPAEPSGAVLEITTNVSMPECAPVVYTHLYLCVPACMSLCGHMWVFAYVPVRVCLCLCMWVRVVMCVFACLCAYVGMIVCIYVYMCMCVSVCIGICMHICVSLCV